jgi:cardiolipin synthase (CMP-forming)
MWTLPNILCGLRILLAPVVAWAMIDQRLGLALALFVLAALTDAVDGYLARVLKARTDVGALLDPLADKLLMLAAFGAAVWSGLAPWWLLAILMGRDLMLLLGSAIAKSRRLMRDLAPNPWGKVSTFAQAIALIWLVAAVEWPGLLPPPPFWVLAIVATLMVIAGTTYAWRWRRSAMRLRQAGRLY